MDITTVFFNGRSQAVRLPKAYRFRTRKVNISRFDDLVILTPPGREWDMLEKSLSMFTADFMSDRSQPPQKRKKL